MEPKGGCGRGWFAASVEFWKVLASMVTKTDGAIQLWKDDTVKLTSIDGPISYHEGKSAVLLSNHLAVKLSGIDTVCYQYSVSIKSDDDDKVDVSGDIINKILQPNISEFAAKEFAYDGKICLLTVEPLPHNIFITVCHTAVGGSPGHGSPGEGDQKKAKRSHLPKKFLVGISYAAKIPLRSVALALQRSESDHAQDALRVLIIVLRQSPFTDINRNLVDLTGGVSGSCDLSMDVSTTMVVTPGPVVDFLLANQNVRDIRDVDWPKARKMLKNLRVKAKNNNEFKIIGLSDEPCLRHMSGGEFPRLEKGSIPWYLKSPNLSEDKNALEVPYFNPYCSQHPRTFETRKAPEVTDTNPKNDIKAPPDSSEILKRDLVAPKFKPGLMPSYFSARCCGMFMLVACLFIGSTSVAVAESLQVQCSVASVATNIRHFCAAHQPTSLCCDAIRGAVLTYEGIPCLCSVGESPDIISMGFTASDLLRINSLCSGRDFSSGDYLCTQPNDNELERDNEVPQYNESAHTVGPPHTAEVEKPRADQPYANREDQDHPSISVIAILLSLVILLIGLLAAATLLIHRRQQLRIGDVVNMARAVVPPMVAEAGPAAVAALPDDLRAAAAAALPPEGEQGPQGINLPVAFLAVAQLVVPTPPYR